MQLRTSWTKSRSSRNAATPAAVDRRQCFELPMNQRSKTLLDQATILPAGCSCASRPLRGGSAPASSRTLDVSRVVSRQCDVAVVSRWRDAHVSSLERPSGVRGLRVLLTMVPGVPLPPEIQLAQRLAGNEQVTRDRALRKLQKYIVARSQRATGTREGRPASSAAWAPQDPAFVCGSLGSA